MYVYLKTLPLTFLISLMACKGQNENIMVEKFDFEVYKQCNSGWNRYVKKDGFEVYMIDFNEKDGGFQREFAPKPNFHSLYKEFYANGNLKKKEMYIGENVKIGISEHFNEDGTPLETINEDEKFGKIKYTDCLTFLDKMGIIDLKTGQGRENENQSAVFELEYSESENIWYITVMEGKSMEFPPEDCVGEPSGWLPVVYLMNGETGEVKEKK
jgi:hypothetical protein